MPTYITYKQADSRWGSKNYNGSSTMATAGCGPTSCAMLAYAVNGKTTPIETMKFMQSHGYAIRNNGTAWAGIPACMKAFGLKDVKEVSSMTDVWNYLSKGYCADFLFRKGTRGGVTWTTSGHYVAVTDYKFENGRHYLYTRDSGGRNHTGWYCYETQMKGLIPSIWVGYVDGETPTPTPTPETDKITVDGVWGSGTTSLTQKVLGCNIDGKMGPKTWKAIQKKVGVKEDGKPGPNTYKAMSKFLGIKEQKTKSKTLIKAWQTWLNSQVK